MINISQTSYPSNTPWNTVKLRKRSAELRKRTFQSLLTLWKIKILRKFGSRNVRDAILNKTISHSLDPYTLGSMVTRKQRIPLIFPACRRRRRPLTCAAFFENFASARPLWKHTSTAGHGPTRRVKWWLLSFTNAKNENDQISVGKWGFWLRNKSSLNGIEKALYFVIEEAQAHLSAQSPLLYLTSPRRSRDFSFFPKNFLRTKGLKRWPKATKTSLSWARIIYQP